MNVYFVATKITIDTWYLVGRVYAPGCQVDCIPVQSQVGHIQETHRLVWTQGVYTLAQK